MPSEEVVPEPATILAAEATAEATELLTALLAELLEDSVLEEVLEEVEFTVARALALKAAWLLSAVGLMLKTMPIPQWPVWAQYIQTGSVVKTWNIC